jgi:tRNA-dihydrouridine synthase A
MITTWALLLGNPAELLRHAAIEHPTVLQLGGSDPVALAQSVSLACESGYREINLNCGCPSDKVHAGHFGACMMREPDLVARCVSAMISAANDRALISVKCRIGVDDQNPDETFLPFIDAISVAGCRSVIVHARKAWLKGLSPRKNRTVPPLNYDIVFGLKRARPGLHVVLNGGLVSLDQVHAALGQGVDGVMIGREVYRNPWMLSQVHLACSCRYGCV